MYIVMTKIAKMPSSVKTRYSHVALVAVDVAALRALGQSEPKFIGDRARGLVNYESRYGLHDGTNGGNTAADRQRREYQRRADELNARIALCEHG